MRCPILSKYLATPDRPPAPLSTPIVKCFFYTTRDLLKMEVCVLRLHSLPNVVGSLCLALHSLRKSVSLYTLFGSLCLALHSLPDSLNCAPSLVKCASQIPMLLKTVPQYTRIDLERMKCGVCDTEVWKPGITLHTLSTTRCVAVLGKHTDPPLR